MHRTVGIVGTMTVHSALILAVPSLHFRTDSALRTPLEGSGFLWIAVGKLFPTIVGAYAKKNPQALLI